MDAVPVVDIGPFLDGSARERVAAEVAAACEDIGFLVVTGHGVPQALIDDLDSVSREFFDLPLDEKKQVAMRPGDLRGYRPVAGTTSAASLDVETPPDLKEFFAMGPPRPPPVDLPRDAEAVFAPTPWPKRPEGMRPVWVDYYRALESLATTLMHIFEVGLGLSEGFFDNTTDRHMSSLHVIHYPPQPQAPVAGQLRGGEHSDFGSLTILHKDQGSGGLQVQAKTGNWVDVPPVPGTFIVNIGDLMAQWTNDRWTSTMHRVVNPPPEEAATSHRVSIVFFHQPNYDAVIEPISTCVDADHPAKYEPITSGEHAQKKLRKIYTG